MEQLGMVVHANLSKFETIQNYKQGKELRFQSVSIVVIIVCVLNV